MYDLLCRCCCQIPSDPRDVAEVEYGRLAYNSHMRLHRHLSIKLDTNITKIVSHPDQTVTQTQRLQLDFLELFFRCFCTQWVWSMRRTINFGNMYVNRYVKITKM